MKKMFSILFVLAMATAHAVEITAQEACEELSVLPARLKGEITQQPTRAHPRVSTFNGTLTSSSSDCSQERAGVSLASPIYEVVNAEVSVRGAALTATFELGPESYKIDRTIGRSGGTTTTTIKLRNRQSREGHRDYVSKEEVRITRNSRGALVSIVVSSEDKFFAVTAVLVPKEWQDPTRI